MCGNRVIYIHERRTYEDQDYFSWIISLLFRSLNWRQIWSRSYFGDGLYGSSWNTARFSWWNTLLTWWGPNLTRRTTTTISVYYASDNSTWSACCDPSGGSSETKVGVNPPRTKLWVTTELKWVPTVITRLDQIKYLQLTNLCDQPVIPPDRRSLVYWMEDNIVSLLSWLASLQSMANFGVRSNDWTKKRRVRRRDGAIGGSPKISYTQSCNHSHAEGSCK